MKRIIIVFFAMVLSTTFAIANGGNPWTKVVVTVYNPTASQCDSTPLVTASNRKIDLEKLKAGKLRWCAVSRDLLARHPYGSYIYLWIERGHEKNGVYRVVDTMNERWKNTIDLLTYDEKYGKWNGQIQTNI